MTSEAIAVQLRRETICPFCGQPLAWATSPQDKPQGIVHGLPLCPELRDNDVVTYLERAAARVTMQRRANRRARA